MQRRSRRTSSQDLLRQTQRLKREVNAFRRRARAVVVPLSKVVSDAEIAEMETPRANALGTLENLLYQDLGDVCRQLDELAGCLRADGACAL